jgi:hypothetical protein
VEYVSNENISSTADRRATNRAIQCHERRFRGLRGTSAYPPRLAVKADIPDRQVRARRGHRLRVAVDTVIIVNGIFFIGLSCFE